MAFTPRITAHHAEVPFGQRAMHNIVRVRRRHDGRDGQPHQLRQISALCGVSAARVLRDREG